VIQVLPRVRGGVEDHRLASRNPRDAHRGDNPLNGDEMEAETPQPQSQDRDGEATTGRFPLALFVVAEVLCTGVLVASVLLWD
jgi:hypothetical protein